MSDPATDRGARSAAELPQSLISEPLPEVPTVSVVIAGRDAEATLPSTLQGLIAQGFDRDRLQVVVVDDGSQDRTAKVAEEHADRLDLTVLRNAASGGVSAARNQGAAIARGDLIVFLDSDDWWGPGHLDGLIEAATSSGADFVRADYVVVDGSRRHLVCAPCGLRMRRLAGTAHINPVDESTMVDFPNCWAGLYRTGLRDRGLLAFDESLRTSEDRLMTWRLHLSGATFARARTRAMYYRKGSALSLTAVHDDRQLDFFRAFREVHAEADRLQPGGGYGAKIVRSVLGISHHHVRNRAKHFDHQVRSRFRDEFAETVGAFSPESVSRALENFGPVRTRQMTPLLKRAGVTP